MNQDKKEREKELKNYIRRRERKVHNNMYKKLEVPKRRMRERERAIGGDS